jgi:hypothetical protein
MILQQNAIHRSEKKRPLVMKSAMHLVDPASYRTHAMGEEGEDPGEKQPEIQNPDDSIDWRTPSHKMGAAGRRMPQGGARGDTYSHYSWMSGGTPENRNILFHMIHVCMRILHLHAADVTNRIQHAL